MPGTQTESSGKRAGGRKRRRGKGSASTAAETGGGEGGQGAVSPSQALILERTELPEASEMLTKSRRNRTKKIMLLLLLDVTVFGLRTFRL